MSFERNRIQTMLRRIGLGVAMIGAAGGHTSALAGDRVEAETDPSTAIVGSWRTAPSSAGRATVRISVENGAIVGDLVELDEPLYPAGDPMAGQARVDRENPAPALRQRPILGLRILEGFSYREGAWVEGRIYDPDNGKTYRCTMRLEGNRLRVRGYVGISLLGRTTQWERIAHRGSGR